MLHAPRVLSIQSHVVHGYCGNKSAAFPLQVLGFEVDPINSVQFCNHTWYKVCQGQVLNETDIGALYEGLVQNDLHHYTHVLTGYIGSVSFLSKVGEIVKELKEVNPHMMYICDPVMGDDGVMYVPKEVLPAYKEKILHLADVILPNQWEAELLTDTTIKTEADALKTIELLHEQGPHTVVLTSSNLSMDPNLLVGYASSVKDGQKSYVKMELDKLDAMFIGAGDLFAALWIAWQDRHPEDLQLICAKVQSTMQLVLKRTLTAGKEAAGAGNEPSWAQRELKLIQSRKDIEDPELCVTVHTIT
ncbi:Pyridoxal kinase [Lamellibrachia satsuma]|nr:Pyridoxal kinase [Lamellibrachia satsuma]